MQVRWSRLFAPLYDAVDIPEGAGVYLLWTQMRGGEWACFHVGEAENLQEAVTIHLDPLRGHHDIHQVLAGHTCGFMYARVEEKERREGICQFLFNTFSPRYGGAPEPAVAPLVVNLPTDE